MFFEVIVDLVVTVVFVLLSLGFFSSVFPGPVGYKTTNVWFGMVISYAFWFMCNMTMWGIGVLKAGQITYQPLSPNAYRWVLQILVYALVYLFVDKRIKNSNHGK